MSRAGKAELEQRVAEISDLLINRVGYRAIVGYAAKRWGLAERQACSYISKAKERILAAAAESRDEQRAKALASYESLFAKQVAAGRLSEARKTLDSIVKLCGLACPERRALDVDFSTFSDAELAQEVAHELPGVLGEAERFAGGTAARSERHRAGQGSIPHTPTLSSGSSSMRRTRSSTAARPAAVRAMPC